MRTEMPEVKNRMQIEVAVESKLIEFSQELRKVMKGEILSAGSSRVLANEIVDIVLCMERGEIIEMKKPWEYFSVNKCVVSDETTEGNKMKAKILIDDFAGRFKYGDIGVSIKNNFFEKYDYHIELRDGRSYYFYKDEIEIISGKDNHTKGKK